MSDDEAKRERSPVSTKGERDARAEVEGGEGLGNARAWCCPRCGDDRAVVLQDPDGTERMACAGCGRVLPGRVFDV